MGFGMRDEYMVPGEDVEHWCPHCGHKIVPTDPQDRQGTWEHESEVAAGSCDSWDDLDSPVCHIEFLRAWDDQTWDTEILEVPPILHHEDCTDGNRVDWFHKVHGGSAAYRGLVMVAVYHLEPYA